MFSTYAPKRMVAGLAAGLAAACVGVAFAASPVAAYPRARLVVAGLGTYSAAGQGLAYQGHVSGDPFSGDFTGAVAAADDSLPAVGECEPAQATLRVDDGAGSFYELQSSGQVCGEYLPLGVMQRFTGRWMVSSTSVRKLTRVEGVLDVRLLNGQSDVYATA